VAGHHDERHCSCGHEHRDDKCLDRFFKDFGLSRYLSDFDFVTRFFKVSKVVSFVYEEVIRCG